MDKLITLMLAIGLSGCISTTVKPVPIDSRCFDSNAIFNPDIGADDLDCGNEFFLNSKLKDASQATIPCDTDSDCREKNPWVCDTYGAPECGQ